MPSDWKPIYTIELTPNPEDIPPDIEALLNENPEEPPPEPWPWRTHFSRLDDRDQKGVLGFCRELDCLHRELAFTLEEMDVSVTVLYEEFAPLKRLALIYHTDNFYFRTHAYREKVFKLINHFLRLGVSDSDRKFNNSVLDELDRRDLRPMANLLRQFNRDKDPLLSGAIKLREYLTHALASRGWAGNWPSLEAKGRVDEYFTGREVERIPGVVHIDPAHERKQEELSRIYQRLDKFREDLIAALKAIDYKFM